MTIAYGYNSQGYFTGVIPMQRNPFKAGEFLLPAMATLVEPPTGYTEDQQPKFNLDTEQWELVESQYKKALDAEKMQLTNEYGVNLYEDDGLGNVILRDNAEVQSEVDEIIKQNQLADIKNTMDNNIVNKAFELTGASSIESASAFFQGYTLRANNASEYINEGLMAHYAIGAFALGDALDTEAKISEYYNLINITMDKFRNSEINNYLAAKTTITGS